HQLHWKNLNGDLGITQFVGLALHPTDADIAYGGTQDTGTQRFHDSFLWTRLLRGDGGADAVSTLDPTRIYQITRISKTGPFVRPLGRRRRHLGPEDEGHHPPGR